MYHLSAQSIGRSRGQSAVGAAAYRASEKFVEQVIDKDTGIMVEVCHDYSGKKGVVHHEMLTPQLDSSVIPKWMQNPEQFWNNIMNVYDTRGNSVFAKEFNFALPKELSLEQNIALAREFVADAFTERGWVSQLDVHYDNPENPHAHLMVCSRGVERGVDGEVVLGKKAVDFDYMGITHSNVSSKSYLLCVREAYAAYQNKHLELAGVNKQVTHKSYVDLGLSAIQGTLHEGAGHHIQGGKTQSERVLENAQIVTENMAEIRRSPEQILRLLSIEKRYFGQVDIEAKVSSIVDNYLTAQLKMIEAGELDINAVNLNSIREKSIELNIGDLPKKQLHAAENLKKDLMKSIMESGQLVQLRGLDGIGFSSNVVPESKDSGDNKYYISKEQYLLEKEFVVAAKALSSIENGKVEAKVVEGYLKAKDIAREHSVAAGVDAGFVLSKEQRAAIKTVMCSGNLALIDGYAGTGKSTIVRQVKEIYLANGISETEIAGVAASGAAADNLSSATGLKATTVDALHYKAERYKELAQFAGIVGAAADADGEGLSKKDLAFVNNYVSPLSGTKVMFVDEAAMISAEKLEWLMREAAECGTKLVMMGDNRQFSVVRGKSGGFAAIRTELERSEAGAVAKLTEVFRQKDAVDRQITVALGQGKVNAAMSLIREHKPDRVQFIEDRDNIGGAAASLLAAKRDYVAWYKAEHRVQVAEASAKRSAVSEIGARVFGAKAVVQLDLATNKDGILLSYKRADIDSLNQSIRKELWADGILKDSSKELSSANITQIKDHGPGAIINRLRNTPTALLQGEQIMFTKNDARVGRDNNNLGGGVKNGQLATVLAVSRVDKDGFADIHVRTKDVDSNKTNATREFWFNSKDYGSFDYGYAQTYHKAQGSSYKQVFLHAGPQMGAESAYVGMTRMERDMKLYISKDQLIEDQCRRFNIDAADPAVRAKIAIMERSDKENLLYGSLERMISRSTSSDFASTLAERGKQGEGTQAGINREYFLDYQSAHIEYLDTYRVMKLEEAKQLDAGNKDYAFFSHEQSGRLLELRKMRAEAAKELLKNPDQYKEHISACKTSLKLIEQHASKGFGKHLNSDIKLGVAEEKVNDFAVIRDFKEPVTLDENIAKNYNQLILAQAEATSSGNITDLKAKAINLAGHQIETDIKQDKLKEELTQVKETIQSTALTNEQSKDQEKARSGLINKLYIDPTNIILENYRELKAEVGVEKAAGLMEQHPELLGEMKGKVVDLKLFTMDSAEKVENKSLAGLAAQHLEAMDSADKNKEKSPEHKQVKELEELKEAEANLHTEIKALDKQKLSEASREHILNIVGAEKAGKLEVWLQSKQAKSHIDIGLQDQQTQNKPLSYQDKAYLAVQAEKDKLLEVGINLAKEHTNNPTKQKELAKEALAYFAENKEQGADGAMKRAVFVTERFDGWYRSRELKLDMSPNQGTEYTASNKLNMRNEARQIANIHYCLQNYYKEENKDIDDRSIALNASILFAKKESYIASELKGFKVDNLELKSPRVSLFIVNNIVEYKMKYYASELLEGHKFNLSEDKMKEFDDIAKEQVNLEQQMTKQLDELNQGKESEVLTKEILEQDKQAVIDSATHKLAREAAVDKMVTEATGFDKNPKYCAIQTSQVQQNNHQQAHEIKTLDLAQARTAEKIAQQELTNLSSSQQTYKENRTQELQEEKQMQLDRGRGMEL